MTEHSSRDMEAVRGVIAEAIRQNWMVFLGEGVVLMVLGALAVGMPYRRFLLTGMSPELRSQPRRTMMAKGLAMVNVGAVLWSVLRSHRQCQFHQCSLGTVRT